MNYIKIVNMTYEINKKYYIEQLVKEYKSFNKLGFGKNKSGFTKQHIVNCLKCNNYTELNYEIDAYIEKVKNSNRTFDKQAKNSFSNIERKMNIKQRLALKLHNRN